MLCVSFVLTACEGFWFNSQDSAIPEEIIVNTAAAPLDGMTIEDDAQSIPLQPQIVVLDLETQSLSWFDGDVSSTEFRILCYRDGQAAEIIAVVPTRESTQDYSFDIPTEDTNCQYAVLTVNIYGNQSSVTFATVR